MTWTGKYPLQRVVPYDSRWPCRFADLRTGLSLALGLEWEIEHVGSTSVPGLAAKPVIDIALRQPHGSTLASHNAAFRTTGWSKPEPVAHHWAVFKVEHGVRAAIGHIFSSDQWPTSHVRLFADWLRSHPETLADYQRLKVALIEDGHWGEDYTRMKTAFVLDVVNQARAARGLCPLSDL
jgi:GrpB-like predicted nucleotidyltransferase (UPF0157 family)